MVGFLSWWDGVELWLSGLDFVVQTTVVMPIVLTLATAWRCCWTQCWAGVSG